MERLNVIIDWSVHREFVFNVSDWFYITCRAAHSPGKPTHIDLLFPFSWGSVFNRLRTPIYEAHIDHYCFYNSSFGKRLGKWEVARSPLEFNCFYWNIFDKKTCIRLFRLIFYQQIHTSIAEVSFGKLPPKYTGIIISVVKYDLIGTNPAG